MPAREAASEREASEFQIRVSHFVWGIPLQEKAGIFPYRQKRPRMLLLSLRAEPEFRTFPIPEEFS